MNTNKPAHAVTCIKMSPFSFPVIENFICIEPLLRGQLSYKATFRGRAIVLNATFNNISVTSWRSVLLVEEDRVLRENHRPATSHTKKKWPYKTVDLLKEVQCI
jgi:hypothetical protein